MQVGSFYTHLKWPGTSWASEIQGAGSCPHFLPHDLPACLLLAQPDLGFITTAAWTITVYLSSQFLLSLLPPYFVLPTLLAWHYQKDRTSDWQSNNFRMLYVIFVFDLGLAAPILITIISFFIDKSFLISDLRLILDTRGS